VEVSSGVRTRMAKSKSKRASFKLSE
jgi:hypothetical protein